jgi:hypothetical protein
MDFRSVCEDSGIPERFWWASRILARADMRPTSTTTACWTGASTQTWTGRRSILLQPTCNHASSITMLLQPACNCITLSRIISTTTCYHVLTKNHTTTTNLQHDLSRTDHCILPASIHQPGLHVLELLQPANHTLYRNITTATNLQSYFHQSHTTVTNLQP